MKLKWLVAVLAIVSGFLISGIVGGLMTDAMGFWGQPGEGFSAAFTVVVVTYIAAPNSKFVTACIALAVGAGVAWLFVEPSWFPESYRDGRAYQSTHLPIAATYIGGILGLLVVAIHNFATRPNNSLKSDAAKPRTLGCALCFFSRKRQLVIRQSRRALHRLMPPVVLTLRQRSHAHQEQSMLK